MEQEKKKNQRQADVAGMIKKEARAMGNRVGSQMMQRDTDIKMSSFRCLSVTGYRLHTHPIWF